MNLNSFKQQYHSKQFVGCGKSKIYHILLSLNFNGTKIVTAKDTNSGQVIAKEVGKSAYRGSDFFKSSFENGKVKAVYQFTDKFTKEGQEIMSETFWFGRNSEGKLNKKVFEKVTDYPVQQEVKKFYAENCPELRD